MKLFAKGLAYLLVALPAMAGAQQLPDDHWYAAVRGGAVSTDQNFNNDGMLYGVSVGKTVGPEYAVEMDLAWDKLDFGIGYGLRHRSIGVNLLTINPEPLWHPYFLMGVGLIEFDGPRGLPVRSDHDFMFNLGIGGQWELVVPNRVFLRADLRFRFDGNRTRQPGQDDFGDGILTVGLQVPFGGN